MADEVDPAQQIELFHVEEPLFIESEPLPREDDEVFDPAVRAHELSLTAMPWREIARECGYVSAAGARGAVRRMLDQATLERSAVGRAEARDLEIARLDAVQHAFWPAAMAGDDKAAMIVLRTINQRGKYEGLEDVDKGEGRNQTIVISGDTASEYIANLERIREEARARALENNRDPD